MSFKEKLNSKTNNLDFDQIQEQNYKYYLEYIKLREANSILKKELASLSQEKESLRYNIHKIESKKPLNQKVQINDKYTNRRRQRRTKNEIRRSFECATDNCKKTYGSEGSLNQHRKLKHLRK